MAGEDRGGGRVVLRDKRRIRQSPRSARPPTQKGVLKERPSRDGLWGALTPICSTETHGSRRGFRSSSWEVYSTDFRHCKEIAVFAILPRRAVLPRRAARLHSWAGTQGWRAIEAERFHEAQLARHICLGVIHRAPHGPIAACCARLRLRRSAQTFRWRRLAPARRAGRQGGWRLAAGGMAARVGPPRNVRRKPPSSPGARQGL
jgi:hypothetical protein